MGATSLQVAHRGPNFEVGHKNVAHLSSGQAVMARLHVEKRYHRFKEVEVSWPIVALFLSWATIPWPMPKPKKISQFMFSIEISIENAT